MATYTLKYSKYLFWGLIFFTHALTVSVLTEVDDHYDVNNEVLLDSQKTDDESDFEEANDPEPAISSQDEDVLTENDTDSEPSQKPSSFYSFSVYDIHGDLVSLGKYRGKVVLVVNVASECGFTDGHYKALIRMKNVLAHTNKFEILAFPCNQFGAQEPGTNSEIQEWVHENYHPNFPLFAKINVLDDNVPEAWQYMIDNSGKAPNWNFWKYLVNDHGRVIDAWGPRFSVKDLFTIVKRHVDAVDYASEEEFYEVPSEGTSQESPQEESHQPPEGSTQEYPEESQEENLSQGSTQEYPEESQEEYLSHGASQDIPKEDLDHEEL